MTDSPGVPPSATAHELFRGFSYVAPMLVEAEVGAQTAKIKEGGDGPAKANSNGHMISSLSNVRQLLHSVTHQ